MQVIAADLDGPAVLGEAEADQRPAHVVQLEHVLLGHDLGQWPVGLMLARDRAGPDELELAVDAYRAGRGAVRQDAVELGKQPSVVERQVK